MSEGGDISTHEKTAASVGGAPAPVVLQVLPALDTGGVERGTIDIAAAVAAAGGRSLVASSGGRMLKELGRSGATHVTLPLHAKGFFAIRRNAAALAKLIRDEGVDIVHARSRAPAWAARMACGRTGTHFVTTFHGTYNMGPPFKKFYNAVMLRGERVIAISNFIADHIEQNYHVDPARLCVIHRGVDLDIFDPQRVPAVRVIQLAEKWRLPDDVPVVMLPGRLTRWKGQLLLVEALARLRNDRVRCLFVGDDQGRSGYRRQLEKLVRRRGLEGVVHLVGSCSDMPAAYMLADVVVSASTDPEAFGRVMAEAQAMGKPVVGADHGASGELVLPGETGWLFKPGDAEDLAAKLDHALSLDTAARETLAAKSIANVRANFSREDMCARTLTVYEEVLAQGDAAGAAA
jgi:glycosyltransferase involved in cell wall biosynthesis